MSSDPGIRIFERGLQDRGREHFPSIENRQRLNFHPGPLAGSSESFERRHHPGGLFLLQEQLMHQVASRAVRGVQGGDQCRFIQGSQILHFPRLDTGRKNPVNAAHPLARARVDFGKPIGRDPSGVFDHGPIHVDNIERPVGPGPDLHRTGPVVL